MQRVLFIHGGPGYNSAPERALLKDQFKQSNMEFISWDEPSVFRGTNPQDLSFQASVSSLKKFLNRWHQPKSKVIAFSFGMNYLMPLIDMIEGSELYIVSAVEDLNNLDQKLLTMASVAPEDVDKAMLKDFVKKDHHNFDQLKINALLEASKAQSIFLNYFFKPEEFFKYFGHLHGSYQFDMQSFLKVRRSYRPDKHTKMNRKATLIFGNNDIMIKRNQAQSKLGDIFDVKESYVLSECGHYPHIEKSKEFIEIIKQ